MATMNPFDLLGDDDNEDPLQLLAAQQQKLPTPASAPKKTPGQAPAKPNAAAAAATAKLPSKPLPPSQAVREAKTEPQRGAGRGQRGGGRGGRGRGFNQDSTNNENNYGNNNGFAGGYRQSEDGEGGKPFERRGGYGGGYRQSEDGEGGKPFERRGGYGGGYRQSEDGEGGKTFERRGGYGGSRGGFRGDRRGGLSNGENADGEYPRRAYERRSGTGRGSEIKREGSGRGNWGSPTDEIAPEAEEPINGVVNDGVNTDAFEKQHGQEDAGDAKKDSPLDEPEVKEPEDKEMTLDEYEKLLEEKRKAILASRPEERKVCLDKEFESMALLANKKNDDEVFVKLGSEKEDKKKEAGEKVKKTKSINEFLKPAEGETYYRPGGRGRGRGHGSGRGGYGGNNTSSFETPSIEDVGQFPTLGSK
ncbi:PREDICTED: translation initiation factor IF-2-like isoform X2 [Ipomoea nil]|uniref:translation initiation factor IF-2-like isoform X2 n=1 Tax=Ipomoea nil TaxID=35883 RepID=UPI0009017473|nr:PREDICTED: translation initiation factor IF-2-like isoform X2 [Ipomoea nil]